MLMIARQWIEGLKRGREEGREAILKVLRRFLAQRFGTALDQFDERLKGLDLAALEYLSEIAFEVERLADFEAALARLQPPAPGASSTDK